ncbi:DUF563 domain-containing protein [Paracoccus sp. S-4012]|uniref:glycosyltransferase family 61 protein n=1 Tax=Paracoccus sp. S-4012 TaxID=2665648 RepID=UPI0018A208CB|nr:glycosyltransferase family 61 protein [Paracoccus sp. S-4012]
MNTHESRPTAAPADGGQLPEVTVAFARELGIGTLDPGESPVGVVPRAGLRLTDLRRPEAAEVADPAKQARIRTIARRYDRPVELRNDILHAGPGLDLFRGQVWSGAQVVEGTFHKKLRPGADELERLDRLRRRNRAQRFSGVNAYFQKPGTQNYFHWMIECLPRLEVLGPLVREGRVDGLILNFGRLPDFVRDSLAHFYPDLVDRAQLLAGPLATPDELAFFVSGGPAAGQTSETRMSTATRRFIEALPRRDAPGDEVILVSRADMENRRLLNEDEVFAYLGARFPVRRIVGARLSIAEQQVVFGRARAIIGVHGAGLSNLIFAPRGCRLIEFTTVQYINRTASFHDSCLLAGGEPHLVLAEEVGGRTEVVNNLGNDLFLPAEGFARLAELV